MNSKENIQEVYLKISFGHQERTKYKATIVFFSKVKELTTTYGVRQSAKTVPMKANDRLKKNPIL
jgi:predicted AAA+ superfamily ATPase